MNISKQEFIEFFGDGTWFRFHRCLLFAVKPLDGVLLSFILNQLAVRWDRLDDGWIPFSRGEVAREINFSKDQQWECLIRLRDGGFIEMKRGELGSGNRFVKVNVVALFKAHSAWVAGRRGFSTTTSSNDDDHVVIPRRPYGGENDSKEERTERHIAREARSGLLHDEVPFEKRCVQKLHEAILREYNVNKNTKAWAKVFSDMQRFEGISQRRIKHAVIWYSKHIGEMFVPTITDAQGFRNGFIKLEKRMAADKPTKPAEIVVPEKIKTMLTELRDELSWPKGSRAQLTEVVVKSWANLEPFNKAIRRIMKVPEDFDKTYDTSPEHYAFLLGELRGYDAAYLKSWFERHHDRLCSWADWNGGLTATIWSLEHKDVVNELEEIARDAGHDVEKFLPKFLASCK